MAAGATTTGADAFRRAVERFPKRVTEALRSVAWRTSRTVRTDAQRRLRAQTHGTGASADAIRIEEHADDKLFEVLAEAPPGRPANLPIWLEFGTVKMAARPYMRPALEASSDAYRRELEDASARVARESFR